MVPRTEIQQSSLHADTKVLHDYINPHFQPCANKSFFEENSAHTSSWLSWDNFILKTNYSQNKQVHLLFAETLLSQSCNPKPTTQHIFPTVTACSHTQKNKFKNTVKTSVDVHTDSINPPIQHSTNLQKLLDIFAFCLKN